MKPEMCSDEAREQGCTCHIPHAGPQDIDPPEPKRDRNCPVHGKDWDAVREQRRDDKITGWS